MTSTTASYSTTPASGRYVLVHTPYQLLLARGISGIYTPSSRNRRRGRGGGSHQQQYYSCDCMGYKTPLHAYTSIQDGRCIAFYHNPLTTDVWLAATDTGEPVILSLGRLPTQILYNQLYSGQTFPGHIIS